jgi:alcohol dehydrogenase (cytochrome c)
LAPVADGSIWVISVDKKSNLFVAQKFSIGGEDLFTAYYSEYTNYEGVMLPDYTSFDIANGVITIETTMTKTEINVEVDESIFEKPTELAAAAGVKGPQFSQAQAAAGRTAYRENCAACHGDKLEGADRSPSLVGTRFDQTWRGMSADVISFHMRRMPPEAVAEPGSLSDETYTNILAYVLISNDFAPGDVDLPTDMAALRKVAIPRLKGAQYDPDAPVIASSDQRALLDNLPAVTDEMLQNPSPNDWLQWGRTSDGQSFSPLQQINKESVEGLKLAWRAPLREGSSMAMPLVHGGVMFLHAFPDTVLAMDASNGMVLWRYQYKPRFGSSQKMGLGLHGDKVLVPTSDLHVLALNARTGELIWDHAIDTSGRGGGQSGLQLRSAPLVAGNKVIQGVTSTFAPMGGFIVGMDIDSGEEVWRFNTIARPGEPEGNSWNELAIEERSGGSVWHQGTYDAELNLIYFGVAPTYDTGPLLHSLNKEGVTNDALYTNCTLALNPDTGELVWHYQHVANDQWDLDWAFERQIVELPTSSGTQKVVMNVGKMAILEALDAATGEYLFSVDTGVQNVITAIDPITGAKTIDPEKMPDPSRECVVCPSAGGARCWPPTSYSPQTKLSYVPITESCMTLGPEGWHLLTSGVGISDAVHPDTQDGMIARLQAIDVEGRELAWTHDLVAPLSTGLLATGGGVLFAGDVEPSLKAFDDATGELLWQTKLDAAPSSSLIAYSVNDKQYVAVLVGITNLHVGGLVGSYQESMSKSGQPRIDSPKGGAAVWVFALE